MKIAYKIVAVILALAIIPMVFLVPIASLKVESTALQLLASLGPAKDHPVVKEFMEKHDGNIPKNIVKDFSLKDIIKLVADGKDIKSTDEISKVLEPLVSPGIILATILILLIICAIMTAIFAIAAKDNRKVIYSSMVGLGLSMMVKYAFEAVAAPFVDGRISLASILNNALFTLVGKVQSFVLSSTFWFIPIVFGCIILWTVLYNMTLPEKEKKERKLMLGED